ncbi:murein biosynthesis integral membrane protein MurJ [Phenylobacterium sp.]|uniref:murein biosynthesis integral membrane protein MurJ n=1 Tax=Phenylobacterium sp. TaxID=1871053 RepID=UPI002F4017BB
MTATIPAAAAKKPSGLLRSSAIYSGLTLVSRFLGLARDLVITARLGGSGNIAGDAYYTALTFPNLFRRMFAEGAFAAAFVPDYSKRLAADGEQSADNFAADALVTMAAAMIAITVACQLAMPWLMRVYSFGFLDNPEKFKLAVILTQITMPYLPCMVIAALFAGVLQARGRFIIYGLYPTILNVVMLVAVLPQKDPTRAAFAASIGVIVAGIGQAALCWWGAHKTGARIRPSRLRLTPPIRALIRRMIPGVIASSATQINLFISAMLASQVPGMRVWLNIAERFYQLPLSLVGVAIGVALLPRLSSALQMKDHDDANAAMDQAVVFGLALSLPAAAALMAMPGYLCEGLFSRGNFTPADAAASASLLFHYGWGVPAFVLIKILQPAFFARGDTRRPMNYSLISVGVNIALGVSLFFTIGFPGIALATAAASWLTVLQMVVKLWRDDTWRPSARATGKIVRVAAACLGLGVALALASHYRHILEAPMAGFRYAKEVTVLLVCLAGSALYPALLFAFGGVTPAEARAALKRRKGDTGPVASGLP